MALDQPRPRPTKHPSSHGTLKPWKVVLHDDGANDLAYMVETVVLLTPLKGDDAVLRTQEARSAGTSLLLTTHRERAELYRDQFASRNLTVTIEPADSN